MSVPHDPVYVPILAKKFKWRVFDDTLSTSHISEKGHITLINPLGIDLLLHKKKLDQYWVNKIETRGYVLRKVLSLREEDVITYHENRDVLYQHLSLLIW